MPAVLLLVVWVMCGATVASADPARPLNVLLVSSFSKDLPAHDAMERGVKGGLGKSSRLFTEFLDLPRLPADQAVGALSQVIPLKYKNIRFDAVIAWGVPAARVIANISSHLGQAALHFPEVSIEDLAELGITNAHHYNFVADYVAALEEARRLTAAKRVVVIGTTDPMGMIRVNSMRRALAALPTLAVEEWLDRPLDDLAKQLADLPPQTVVMYLLLFSDGHGVSLTPFAAAQRLTERSRAPIFSPWESLLGSGVVGGHVLSHEAMGAEIASAIVTGRPSDAPPPSAMRLIYDWQQLAGWGMDEVALAPTATLINRTTSPFYEYRVHIAAVALFVVALLALILVLARAVRLRNRAVTDLAAERATLAERVKARTAELARSNTELEQFAYAISHDLRQPLRMISGHLTVLQRQMAESLNHDQTQSFAFAVNGAKRLDSMILSLLDYSRVGRGGTAARWIDSRVGLDEALAFLAPELSESGAEIVVLGDWPRIYVVPDSFERVLLNLIGNALKYRVPDRRAVVEVSVRPQGNEWLFSICDNGIGISPDGASRLFQVFQRLVSAEDFPGNGVGLAVCRRIVEAQGGRIWAESDGPDLGARFSFTLPRFDELDTSPRDSAG